MSQLAQSPMSLPRIGYVLKVYPRLSQTFVLNEILEHESAGLPLDIFSLRLPDDGYFHESLAKVRSRVTYLPKPSGKMSEFWEELRRTSQQSPQVWSALGDASDETASEVKQALMLAREIHERGIEHLHAHFGTVATTVARLAAEITGITYSFTAHAKDIFHETVQPAQLRRKLADATAVVTVSRYNVDHLTRTYGDAARGLELVYNGLNLDDYPFESPVQREPLILGVGRLVEKKGFQYLIDACHILKREGQTFRCEIVGAGVLSEHLHNRIVALDLDDRVTLTGALPQGAVREKIRRAAMLAVPCVFAADGDRDGLPTVLLEAMALGTPCIATDVTGIPEVIARERTGLVAAQRDARQLAAACHRLLDDSQLRVSLARAARKLVEARFDIRANTRALREIFANAVQSNSFYPVIDDLRRAGAMR